MRQRDVDDLYLRTFFEERFVACETEIDDVALVFYGLLNIRHHEQFELLKIRYPPYDIIAEPYIIKSGIHFGDTAHYSVKCSHRSISFYNLSIIAKEA